ncbi:probable disease resistance protein At1g61300 isoform X2 [Lolium perenne]|uniref:probable disease resistance protein At1g61300 isoform X1 n=1 Tax=Lolium perenne TaxID=4522 RepID=UPI0021F5F1EC|nr:probable disease resistance protein At1g61300 isoform X1 [Lolium perenne]XP_051186766.1 probable disease resistance protein At1g61300 isoform X2 [Lolium perenne]XP_051186767.1 probable disease resistance protein At1g61300 isoform X1 [Lolium perenne]XP_051186769.1 probable disease resistance protein At1g61300 isoform X2 [Lolium perenne]
MAQVVAIVNTLIKPLYNIVFKHLMYPFTASRNVKHLKEATQGLIAKGSDVQHEIEIAERNGMKAKNEVRRWLENVDAIKSDEEAISQVYDDRCNVLGCISINCWSNYKISKSAEKELLKAQECAKIDISVVAVQPLPPSVREMPVSSTGLLSEELNVQKAAQCIRDSSVGMIGIWGLGGVGKTHLLKKINNSFVGDSFFDVVVFVTASKECSAEKIQAEIVKKLGLRNDDDIESQANIIYDFLSRRSFLVLLDDLWEQLDLQATGVPYPLGFVGEFKRKVVLTTRSRVVCGAMNVRKEIKVDCLRQDEAFQLFQENVGQEIIFSNPRIGALSKELVKELKGLPLALIATGKAMYPKKDPSEWETAIRLLRRSGHDVGDPTSMENTIFFKLKLSYDSLGNDTMRRCFLICSLWPEDSPIAKDDLIQCWMGLSLLNKCDIQSSYSEGYNIVGHLQAASLLEATEDSSEHLKMHDVIRDMAIWISCGCGENNNKWVVHAEIGKTASRKCIPWNRVEYLSMMGNGLEELPYLGDDGGVNENSLGSVRSKCWLGSCCTELRTLLLQDNKFSEKALGNIYLFTTLTYLDLSHNQIFVLPLALCALGDLEYLNLSYNYISELPKDLKHLIKLKFLYLRGNPIHTVPKGTISRLEELQVLDLLSSQVLSRATYTLSLLQELDMLDNLKAVEIGVKGDATYELVGKFPRLPIRSIHLSRLIGTPSFSFLDGFFSSSSVQTSLHDLTIYKCYMQQILIRNGIGGAIFQFDILKSLTLDSLLSLKRIIWKRVAPESLFPRLTYLAIVHCQSLRCITWAMYLPCLERILVNGCGNMSQIVRTKKKDNVDTEYKGQESPKAIQSFPCLKYFELQSLRGLSSICDPEVTFPSLETMEISFCPKLKRLPFLTKSMPQRLRNISVPLVQMKWWETLEWADEDVKRAIQPLVNSDISDYLEQNPIYL